MTRTLLNRGFSQRSQMEVELLPIAWILLGGSGGGGTSGMGTEHMDTYVHLLTALNRFRLYELFLCVLQNNSF